MTLDQAIKYLDFILKEHPHLRHGDFGQAVHLGVEALKRVQAIRGPNAIKFWQPLPGETKD